MLTGLVRSTLYWSPDDDTITPLLNFVQITQHMLRLAAFTFTLPTLTSDLIALHAAGKDVACVFDLSQSQHVPTEGSALTALKDAGVPFVVGTSSKHQIMHQKFIIRDNLAVLWGSYNFTSLARLESNVFAIDFNPSRAAVFLSKWQETHDWIVANLHTPA